MNEVTPIVPTLADVLDAARRLDGVARRTPLLQAEALGEALGCRLYVKAEPLQRTGSFKFRGAYNHVSRLDKASLDRGVVAYSSGNHAQAVAAAAKLCGAPAVIVMPKDAPAIKVAGTKRHGAEVVFFDRATENREAIGGRIAAERGMRLVRPYDDPYVIAGQGTIGLEIGADCHALGFTPDLVVAPVGGGGLISGTALGLEAEAPNAQIYSAEPAGWNDTALSLEAGERRKAPDPPANTLCDALLAPMPGELTFAINRRRLSGGLAVSDDEVLRAMAAAFIDLKLIVEPGGAAALAAVLARKLEVKGRNVVVVCSGGNVDPETYKLALERGWGE
ncbi:MAG: threonine/serine dehydratase [Alphaproteobacteria bacterium]